MSKLENLMLDYGIPDTELARRLGVTRQSVQRTRKAGLRKKVDKIKNYAEALSFIIGIN
jgi:transcriptional regulator with XRE-family HTH domain